MKNDIPIIAYGFDSYNQTIHYELSHTLRLNIGDDNKAKVIIKVEQNDIPKNNGNAKR